MGTTKHATFIDRLGGRRINDRIGQRHNICGAELSLGDVLVHDFRACWDSPDWRELCCVECAKRLGLPSRASEDR